MSSLLVTITVDSTDFYLSNKQFVGTHYYYPFVVVPPTIEIGVVSGGLVRIKYGSITLSNDKNSNVHPFGTGRYKFLFDTQVFPYPIEIRTDENATPIITGNAYFSNFRDDGIVFDISDIEYEQILTRYTQTEKWCYVENISSDTPAQITANNHQFVTGQIITFERMIPANSDLEYSETNDNYFIVGNVIDANTFELHTKDNVDVVGADIQNGAVAFSELNNRVGLPQENPFTFGQIINRTPVIKKYANEVANPYLLTASNTYPIEVREDGVLIGTTDSNSAEYFTTLPTSSTITLNANTTGVISISGMSRNGATLTELFTYLATKLGLGFERVV